MKKIFLVILILLIAFSSSSCSIIEKLFFNRDNSGNFSITLELADIADYKDFNPDKLQLGDAKAHEELLTVIKSTLGEIEGISNLRVESNKENLILSILFDFSKIESLNNVLSAYGNDRKEGDPIDYQEFFIQGRKSIIKTDLGQIKKIAKEIELKEEGLIDFMKAVYGEFSYETVIEFEKKIKSISNDEYQIDGKKTIRMKRNLLDKEDLEKSTAVTIKTKE